MPTISIIVPVYNTERFLNKCIDSILNQTYTDWELILVDDGSKDNSGKICDEYGKTDERIKVIHKPNGGVSSARNSGLSMAQGKYACFIDADDWVEPTYLEDFQLDKVESDFYVSGASYDVYDNAYSQLIYKQKFCKEIGDIKEQFMEQQLDENGYPWGKIYKLSIIRDNKLNFNASLLINEDHIFVLQYYYMINSLSIVPSGKYHYTVFDGSGRKLSAHFSPFDTIKLASLLFDETIINLNKKWKFPSAYFTNLKKKYVLSKRLYGIASLVREKRLSSITDEMNYWRNHSYVPRTISERLILFFLRRNLPSIVVFVVLYIIIGTKRCLPRNRTKLILNDLSRRSTLIK